MKSQRRKFYVPHKRRQRLDLKAILKDVNKGDRRKGTWTKIILVLVAASTIAGCSSPPNNSSEGSSWNEIVDSGTAELKAQATCFALPGSNACNQIDACYKNEGGCFPSLNLQPNSNQSSFNNAPDWMIVQEAEDEQLAPETSTEGTVETSEQLAAATFTEMPVESIDDLPPGASPGWLPRCVEMKNPDSSELNRGEWDWIQGGGPLNLDEQTLNDIVRCKANYGIRMGYPDGTETCAAVLMVILYNTAKYGEIVRDSRNGQILAIYEGWWNNAICGVVE